MEEHDEPECSRCGGPCDPAECDPYGDLCERCTAKSKSMTTIELPYPLGGGVALFQVESWAETSDPGRLYVRASCALVHSVVCLVGFEGASPWHRAFGDLLVAMECANAVVASWAPQI